MAKTEIVRVMDTNTPAELRDVLVGAFPEKPTKEGLQKLREILENHPERWRHVFDLGDVARGQLVKSIVSQDAAQIALKANIVDMRRGMDYKDAPMLERLLIDNVINAWLRCQWTEIRLADIAGEVTYREVEFWEKRLSLSQARYLRACETLTRVRKLARNTPALQVNIAAEGGQQVNVSGELNVKKGEGENHETSNGQ